jgi:hypothetical protein
MPNRMQRYEREKRHYTRLPLTAIAELQLSDGSSVYGETADISLDGAFIHLAAQTSLAPAQQGTLRLWQSSGRDGRWARLNVTVMHVRPDGIGVRLDGAQMTHYSSFLRLLLDGAMEVDALLEEVASHPGPRFRFN